MMLWQHDYPFLNLYDRLAPGSRVSMFQGMNLKMAANVGVKGCQQMISSELSENYSMAPRSRAR